MNDTASYKEHYDVIGVTPGCSWDSLRAAYRRQVQIWHPDRFPEKSADRAVAEEHIKKLNRAYNTLSSYQKQHGELPRIPVLRVVKPARRAPAAPVNARSADAQRRRAFGGSRPATRAADRKPRRFIRIFLLLAAALAYYFIWTSDLSYEDALPEQPPAASDFDS